MAPPPSLSAWHSHLKAYREAHPGKSMKECMKEAAKTYKKT